MVEHIKRRLSGADWYVVRGPHGAVVLQTFSLPGRGPFGDLSIHSRAARKGFRRYDEPCNWIGTGKPCYVTTFSCYTGEQIAKLLPDEPEVWARLDKYYEAELA